MTEPASARNTAPAGTPVPGADTDDRARLVVLVSGTGSNLGALLRGTRAAARRAACSARSPWAKTTTRAVLPVPCGRDTVPRTIWSALRGSTPRRKTTSTVASNLVIEVDLAR